ncbi:LOW QUALITY PROTEIN: hypothetical protein MAR_011306 [Mya arenaria]|uniref:Uncharacterized protein n=1 Tax=Mya arenaria TaxID=6604 RepID=A0ABY7FX48_MYAAR|nr:LOW QUALITY PROTEIN: hypothetical protein MAR_011306 [Mya arenaria]
MRFRNNLKENPELWDKYKKLEKKRKGIERRNRANAERHRKGKESQRRYKMRLKEKGTQVKNNVKTVLTRSERGKKRNYWREKQAKCRAGKSAQKKGRIKEHDRNYRIATETNKKKNLSSGSTNTGHSSMSKSALKKASSRIKLPKHPKKFGECFNYIVQWATPPKRAALSNKEIICSPAT